jgi:hypothetical protein
MAVARPTRRIFQFSITSMLLVTTLVAIWLAWELSYIRERQTWLSNNAALVDAGTLDPGLVAVNSLQTAGVADAADGSAEQASPDSLVVSHLSVKIVTPQQAHTPREAKIPFWRRWLGDTAVATILDPDFNAYDRARVTRLFPEAELVKPPVFGTLSLTLDPSASETPAESEADETNASAVQQP